LGFTQTRTGTVYDEVGLKRDFQSPLVFAPRCDFSERQPPGLRRVPKVTRTDFGAWGIFQGTALRAEPGPRDGATRLAVGWSPQYSLDPEPLNGPWTLEEDHHACVRVLL
jgi:hypothetical protein